MRIYEQDAVEAARELVGWKIYAVEVDGSLTGGVITETEAYRADDAASHSYNGETKRNRIMFGPAGHIYVYFTYGMHWCMNIVTGERGSGEAVLIRAISIDKNMTLVRERRPIKDEPNLTNGPAKLCQALGVTGEDNGQKIGEGRFILMPPTESLPIEATTRIGIKKDTHRLWRFVANI